jgi:NhaP-type Na+/H+ or K+/H+ antiporter
MHAKKLQIRRRKEPMVEESTAFVVAFGVPLFAFSLISRKISRSMVTDPMIFVTAGILFSPEVLDLVRISSDGTLVLSIVELALLLTLFSDASQIKLQTLLREKDLPNRLFFR